MAKQLSHRFLGELESAIMEALWIIHVGSVRDVMQILKKKRSVAYTTVMTVMGRLHAKGLLKRKLETNGAYLYCPSQEKEDYATDSSRRAIEDLIKTYGDVAVAQFMGLIEKADPSEIKKWKIKLKSILK